MTGSDDFSQADSRAGGRAGSDGFSAPTYHEHEAPESVARGNAGTQSTPASARPNSRDLPASKPGQSGNPRPAGTGSVTVTRAVVARSRYFSKLLAYKVIEASEADGAKESGLTALIWNQVMSYGADAMITVALAGTVFFSATSDAQRGNVLLYLATTVAPFAIVAPVIGPALDRFQHGRRWVMAGTALGRGALAVVMALNFTDLFILFPAALGSLVLSKAYAVIRASAAPRLVPTGMTLVEANARLSLFGLVAAILGGGVVGAAIKVTGSYPLGLWVTAAAFLATAVYSLRLPKIVDSPPNAEIRPDRTMGSDRAQSRLAQGLESPPASRQPRRGTAGPSGRTASAVGPVKLPLARRILERIGDWSRRGFSPAVLLALQGEVMMRWLSGFVTLFLAFYIETTSHGSKAVLSLGALGAAAGLGNFAGTVIGTRLKLTRPEVTVIVCTLASAVVCVITAVFFTITIAVLTALLSAAGNSLSKLSMDALIQRDVGEALRSSAFARSETFLQLGWVLGATIALLLPSSNGRLGFTVAALVTVTVTVLLAVNRRAMSSSAEAHR